VDNQRPVAFLWTCNHRLPSVCTEVNIRSEFKPRSLYKTLKRSVQSFNSLLKIDCDYFFVIFFDQLFFDLLMEGHDTMVRFGLEHKLKLEMLPINSHEF
jgi:hypothetical protein